VSAYLRRAWIVVWKDVLTERRSKESLNALLFFSVLLLFIFQFALGPERARVETALPGLLWLGFILAGVLGLGRSFLVEQENDCWEGLVLTPGDKSAIYLGKLAGNVLVMAVVEAALLVLFPVFFGLDLTGAITAQVRARELLFPVLLLPAQVPVLLGAVSATEIVLAGQPLAEAAQWLKLLAAADVVYLVVGLLTFEFVLEGA